MLLFPSTRVALQVKVPLVMVAAVPLQVSVARPEPASLMVPLMVSAGLATVAASAGEAMLMAGAVVSSVI